MRKLGSAAGVLLAFSSMARAGTPAQVEVRVPVHFEPNFGQASGDASFVARGQGYRLSFEADQVRLALRGQPGAQELRLRLVGATPTRPSGEEPLDAVSNYLIGPKARWRTGVPHF